MKDEIKAILEFLDDNLWVKYGNTYQKSLTDKECKLLLDHINNLQEENEKLKSYIKLTDEEAKQYIYDTKKEIERLNQYIDFYKDLTEKQNKEIDRLNNIINRMEEDLREMYMTFGEFNEEYTEKKIRELKEGK